jgi:predicted secreted hydrolase
VRRRQFLESLALGGLCGLGDLGDVKAQTVQSPPGFAPVVPGYVISFPRDEGSHPDFRVEWWYITGWLENPVRKTLGFQVTFFRVRTSLSGDNPSAFAPRQVLIAHAALSDPARGSLLHEERAARAAFALAGAREGVLDVWIDDWSLRAEANGCRARLAGASMALDLALTPTQPPLLQGEAGLSRKGPRAESASYYYSLPHLAVRGEVFNHGRREAVHGRAWFDHEWSSSYMDERAVGWDWIGINLDDGGALMAFRMRTATGASLWSGATLRTPGAPARTFGTEAVHFTPGRTWRSPRSGADYPVAWRVTAGAWSFEIEPLMDDQENDTRKTTGAIYWEGAVIARHDGRVIGRGYLELTGYWRRMRL